MNWDRRIKDMKEEVVLLPRCAHCHEVPPAGIAGGMNTSQGFFCEACLAAHKQAAPGRDEYIDLLKKIKDLIK